MVSIRSCFFEIGRSLRIWKEKGTANVELALVLSILMGASAPFTKMLAPGLLDLQKDTDTKYILQSLINADVRIAYIDETGDERILDEHSVISELSRAASYIKAQTMENVKSEGRDFCVVAAMINTSGYCSGDVKYFAEADTKSGEGSYNSELIITTNSVCLTHSNIEKIKESVRPGACERRFVVVAYPIDKPESYVQFVANNF